MTTTNPMTTISDKDRAEAQAMAEVFLSDGRIVTMDDDVVPWWLAVRDHVLSTHECPAQPTWRQITFDEIQPGWEVRSRHKNGFETTWGVAHHRDNYNDWVTEAGIVLASTVLGWTYETTAPEPPTDQTKEGKP